MPLCFSDRDTIQALFGMMRSNDLGVFTKALAGWQFPAVNLLFGDRKGNVGYWLQAAIPMRSRPDVHHGAVAVDGSDSRNDWQGFIPHDLLPHVINPERGWVASGNHRPVGSFYPVYLGLGRGSTGHTVRSWRLYERLLARDRFEPADVLDIHFDTVNPARRDIVRIGLHLRDGLQHELSADTAAALKLLEGWHQRGARADLTEVGAVLASEINMNFRSSNTPLANHYGGGAAGQKQFCDAVKKRLALDAKAHLNKEEQAFFDQAVEVAWKSARARYGADTERWLDQARGNVQQQRRRY